MSVEGGFGLTVTVEMSTELIKMLSDDWSEPIQVKVRRLENPSGSATHEMVAIRHTCSDDVIKAALVTNDPGSVSESMAIRHASVPDKPTNDLEGA